MSNGTAARYQASAAASAPGAARARVGVDTEVRVATRPGWQLARAQATAPPRS